MRDMAILSCSDCGDTYYVLPSYVFRDSGLCAKCENQIAELEEKYAPQLPPPQPSPKVRCELREAEWQAFLGIMGAFVFSAFAWWGIISAARAAAPAVRHLWRLL